jgi:ribosome maturation factor RimP
MAARAGSAPPSTAAEQALVDILRPVLADEGLVVEELRLLPSGRRRVLKLLVDRDPYAEEQPPDVPIEGLSLDEVAEVSRVVGDRLDGLDAHEDPLAGLPYTLEVSSPGVDRPLTLPRHFRRNVGRLVDLRTSEGATVRGRIASATPDGVVLTTDGGRRELGWVDVQSASVQVEFRHPAQLQAHGSAGESSGFSGGSSGDMEG